ncbi:MAG: stalk domain-containing protein [Clostridia bacterium]|nr:stalk domain-containing protein [Clostridia bacterium]
MTEIINYTWTYSALDSLDARVNGRVTKLSAPVKYVNGIFYIPVSLIAECYGYEVKNLGNGVYTVSFDKTPTDTVNAVINHLN